MYSFVGVDKTLLVGCGRNYRHASPTAAAGAPPRHADRATQLAGAAPAPRRRRSSIPESRAQRKPTATHIVPHRTIDCIIAYQSIAHTDTYITHTTINQTREGVATPGLYGTRARCATDSPETHSHTLNDTRRAFTVMRTPQRARCISNVAMSKRPRRQHVQHAKHGTHVVASHNSMRHSGTALRPHFEPSVTPAPAARCPRSSHATAQMAYNGSRLARGLLPPHPQPRVLSGRSARETASANEASGAAWASTHLRRRRREAVVHQPCH